ncbi:acidic repeat-containing protein [Vombatus ursinus]|uniref:SprT-like domain-containing protein n=1 Tax=Vombatus ursinus TaxID=29139 RepID=A0A4X2L320_VOMUR|nr:acidic repeat-containing protein [Vombatus ursinus]
MARVLRAEADTAEQDLSTAEEGQEGQNQKCASPKVLESSSDEEFETVLSHVKIPKISSCSPWEERNDQCDEAGNSTGELVKRKASGEKPKEKKAFKTPSRDVPSSVQDSGAPTPGFSGASGLMPTLSTPPVTSASYADAPKSGRRINTCQVAGCFLAELSSPASDYVKYFQLKREELIWKLYHLYNATIFGKQLPERMSISWNKKMRTTAGFCHFSGREDDLPSNRSIRIELSEKVCDSADRLRDTLIHELCHGATWLFHGVRDCHGPFWKIYAQKSVLVHPELPAVKRCHSYEIHYKFIYECAQCKARVGRHSKSLNVSRVVCSLCHGSLRLLPPTQRAGTSSQTQPTPAATCVTVSHHRC